MAAALQNDPVLSTRCRSDAACRAPCPRNVPRVRTASKPERLILVVDDRHILSLVAPVSEPEPTGVAASDEDRERLTER
jgi:hypothetical protein